MFGFLKKLFGSKSETAAEVPYKVEAPVIDAYQAVEKPVEVAKVEEPAPATVPVAVKAEAKPAAKKKPAGKKPQQAKSQSSKPRGRKPKSKPQA